MSAVADTPLELAPDALTSQQGYFLLTSLVVPRPIAWVSTTDRQGGRNLAPHSYFTIASTEPLIVQFVSSHGRDGAGKRKDTLQNVLSTGEFVVNVVDREHVVQMNVTSAQMPPEEDEFWWAQVPSAPSRTVAAPRVRDAPASLECRLVEHLRIGNGTVMFGEVTWLHVKAHVLDGDRVDADRLDPVARLGGSRYTPLGSTFSLPRPDWQALRQDRDGI